MAYRVPLFGFQHAARTAGSAAITPDNADAAYPKARLIDGLRKRPFRFGATNATHTIDVDLGAGIPTVDRLLIPAGHDLNGQAVLVRQDDNSGFATPTTLFTGTVGTAGVVDLALTASSERYLRFEITPSGRWSIPELWYTTRRVTSRGPGPDWVDQFLPNVVETILRGGEAYSQKNGPRRRQFSFSYVQMSDADRAILVALLDAVSDGATPFWLWPPDDAEAPVLVKLAAQIPMTQGRPNPRAQGQAWGMTIQMLESIA